MKESEAEGQGEEEAGAEGEREGKICEQTNGDEGRWREEYGERRK